jgi:hypothetical protein
MDDLVCLKRRISPHLMALPCVSGVGISRGKLAVYLTVDTPADRERVRQILNAEAPGAEAEITVTGTFRKQ